MVEVRGGVEFGILGHLTVSIDGHQLNIGGARQRVVLAGLVLNAGRTVSVAELTDLVWRDEPPSSARGQLHMAVHQLRRVLSRSGRANLLRTDAAGYRLLADPAQVDLTRFEAGIARARTSAAGGERATAVSAYRAALALWRDRPLRELANDALTRRTEWLCELRLAAAEECLELELASGRDRELIPELVGYVSEYPLRERLVAALMQALGRNGRLADALEVYQRTVATLREELGVDPGPELRRCHLELLRGDSPELAATPPVVKALQPLVAEHPLVEPLAAQLMPAPHANGRGAEPHQAEQDIGRAQAYGPPPPGPPAREAPAQLPLDVFGFVGRHAEIARLDAIHAAAQPTTVVIALTGSAGVGKTTLAVHWAHRVVDRFPDGQLYVNLRGFDPGGSPMTPAEAICGFLEALGVPPQRWPTEPAAQIGMYRTLLAGKRMLVVLDNARAADQVRPLLPGAPGCLVLITSRHGLTSLIAAEAAQSVALDLLTLDEARALLAQRLGADRTAAEPDAVDTIVGRCARLPLALAIVAARAATQSDLPLSVLARDLREGDRLDALSTGDASSTDVRSVFFWSYQALSESAARLLRLLGLHPTPEFSAPAAASLAGLPAPRVWPVLAELTRAHLVTEPSRGRYALHDLLHEYTRQSTLDEQPDAATGRMLDHYLHTARAADRLLEPARDPVPVDAPGAGVTVEAPADHQQAMRWFTVEYRVLIAAADHAARTGFDPYAWLLADAVATFLYRRGKWHDQVAAQRHALLAAARSADVRAQGSAHIHLARTYLRLRQDDQAEVHLREALDLYRDHGDPSGQAQTYHYFGALREQQGRYQEAAVHGERAVAMCRASGLRFGLGHALNAVGWYHVRLGSHRDAITFCREAIAVTEDLGDRAGRANAWDTVGYAHHHLGEYDLAVTSYRQAIDLYHDLGDRYHESVAQTHLAETHRAAGRHDCARSAYREALIALDELGHADADRVRAALFSLRG